MTVVAPAPERRERHVPLEPVCHVNASWTDDRVTETCCGRTIPPEPLCPTPLYADVPICPDCGRPQCLHCLRAM